MNKQQIIDKIIDIVNDAEISDAEVTKDSNLRLDLNFDSLDYLEVELSIEKEFDILIPDDASERLSKDNVTIEDVADYVYKTINTDRNDIR